MKNNVSQVRGYIVLLVRSVDMFLLPLCPKVRKELNCMESLGVVAKVDEPKL